jgi:hypothetical protein
MPAESSSARLPNMGDVNLRSSGWSTANSPYYFSINLLFGPIWMLISDSSSREQPSGSVRGSDHLYAFGWRFIAKRTGQVVINRFDS